MWDLEQINVLFIRRGVHAVNPCMTGAGQAGSRSARAML
jgi:hypothetical protein